MKILAVADEPCKALWDYYGGEYLKGIDLILSAGDLPPQYLSFLVTFANCPLLYVHGNHDGVYDTHEPDGCICIDDRIFEFGGIRIAGLGGSMEYNKGPYQYTEKAMSKRSRRLGWKIRRKGGIDILLTHAPARGLGDQEDLTHRGFETFNALMDRWHPDYMIHGHIHMNYGYGLSRMHSYGDTAVVNAYERYLFEL